MKVRDIIKLIEADGWYLVPAKGGHRQYKLLPNQDASPLLVIPAMIWLQAR